MRIPHNIRLRTRAPRLERPPRRGFSLIELLIVMLLIAIAFGLGAPMLAGSSDMRLREAARMLAADIEFVQSESMAHADDPRLIRFDAKAARYWIAAASDPATPITDPVTGQPFNVTFGTGRAGGLKGVRIAGVNVGGDNILKFNPYGVPDQSTKATITLASGSAQMIVEVAAQTGDVTIKRGKSIVPVTPIPMPSPAPVPVPIPGPPPASPFM